MKKITCFVCFLVSGLACNAAIRLPAVFTDNMVLQRNSDAAVWGWSGEPDATVRLVGSWNSGDTVTVKSNNYAFWSASIRTPEAGGPYTLTIWDNEKTVLSNVMSGEVWICSGQSNMEWSVNHGIKDGEREAAEADYNGIRILHVPKTGSETPQENCIAAWAVCSPEIMRKTSAAAYFFGRRLHRELHVPVGLIVSAWGGTPAEVWVPEEKIEQMPALSEASKIREDYPWWPKNPGACYNAMIHPLMPYSIAGAIWYQGESNANARQAPTYDLLMRTLITEWRAGFRNEFPFYYVQIAPFEYGDPQDKAYLVREQQTKTLELPRTGMAVIWDLTDDVKNIHPLNKQDVGKRLADRALSEVYGIPDIVYQSPMYQSMEVKGNTIRIFFSHVSTGLKCSGKKITQFTIAGEDRRFVPAEVKIDGKSVIVSAKEIKKPVAVRFLFDNASVGNLFSNEGLPVAPFRTDHFSE